MILKDAKRFVVTVSSVICCILFRKFFCFCYSKPFRLLAPVFIGICLGIAVHMTLVPYGEGSCESCTANRDPQEYVKIFPRSDETAETPHEAAWEEIPARNEGKTSSKPTGNVGVSKKRLAATPKQKKLFRPWYAATELGIKEKLFVGVLTSRDTIDTLGVAVNRTLTSHVTKIVFFMADKGPKLPPGMTIVSFSDKEESLLATHALRYISERCPDSYDFYLLVSDRTYLRGAKLRQFLDRTSVGRPLQLGAASRGGPGGTICPLTGGLLLSQLLLSKAIASLEFCHSHFRSDDASLNIAQCLLHAAKSSCTQRTEMAADRTFTYFKLEELDFDRDIASLKRNSDFNSSLSIFPIPDDKTYYKLHRYFCDRDLELNKMEMEKIKLDILRMSKFLPEHDNDISWPIGVPEPSKAKGQLDLLRWDYFTGDDIFFRHDFTNVDPLTGADREGVRNILEEAMRNFKQTYGEGMQLTALLNGYRRFDPQRGMDYVLDLMLKDAEGQDVEKRVRLVRPLSEVEVVPMPVTSEGQILTLVLTVTEAEDDVEGVGSFLDNYAHVCIEQGEKTHLFVVFVRSSGKPSDPFSVSKSMLTYYKKKYAGKSDIDWAEIRTNSSHVPEYSIADALTSHLRPEALVVMVTEGMEFAVEYFNRVRMNVIRGRQVFFPIGFWQYKPNLIYESKPYPTTIAIDLNVGHYDALDYEHGAFFLSDYQAARASLPAQALAPASLFDVFLAYRKLHVFRAVDPGLKHRFKYFRCPMALPGDVFERCLKRRATSLATRSQLADLVFQHQKMQTMTSPAT